MAVRGDLASSLLTACGRTLAAKPASAATRPAAIRVLTSTVRRSSRTEPIRGTRSEFRALIGAIVCPINPTSARQGDTVRQLLPPDYPGEIDREMLTCGHVRPGSPAYQRVALTRSVDAAHPSCVRGFFISGSRKAEARNGRRREPSPLRREAGGRHRGALAAAVGQRGNLHLRQSRRAAVSRIRAGSRTAEVLRARH